MNGIFPKWFQAMLWFIAVVQLVLGLAFLVMPERAALGLGLAVAPGWTNWLFGQMAARFLGFSYGMAFAARHPLQAAPWIKAMVAIQVIDWVVTLKYLASGAITLAQVSTAPYLPVVFVVLLLLGLRRHVQQPVRVLA
jgi:hypothetical protein